MKKLMIIALLALCLAAPTRGQSVHDFEIHSVYEHSQSRHNLVMRAIEVFFDACPRVTKFWLHVARAQAWLETPLAPSIKKRGWERMITIDLDISGKMQTALAMEGYYSRTGRLEYSLGGTDRDAGIIADDQAAAFMCGIDVPAGNDVPREQWAHQYRSVPGLGFVADFEPEPVERDPEFWASLMEEAEKQYRAGEIGREEYERKMKALGADPRP